MTHNVGIIRNKEKLSRALEQVLEMKKQIEGRRLVSIEQWELANMLILSELVIKSALIRTESRGAHFRTDYPYTDDVNWKINTII